MGLLERGGKVRTFVVPNTSQDILHPIMVDNVANGTTLITDHHKSYLGLDNHFSHIRVKGETGDGNFKLLTFSYQQY